MSFNLIKQGTKLVFLKGITKHIITILQTPLNKKFYWTFFELKIKLIFQYEIHRNNKHIMYFTIFEKYIISITMPQKH